MDVLFIFEKIVVKTPAGNIGLAIWRLKCFYETFVQGSTLGILLNICAINPPHRQAANRWWQLSYAKNYETKIHFPYYPADTSITFRAT